jgi:hypothetical protein
MAKKRTLAAALAEIDQRVDADELLDAAAREMIKKKARETVLARRRAEVEKIALEAAIAEEERKFAVVEEWETVTVNLAPYCAMVTLDGTMYFHGIDYEVPYSVARTIEDVMARTWEHQNEIQGQRRKGDVAWEATRKRRYENGGVALGSSEAQRLQSTMTPGTINTRTLARV